MKKKANMRKKNEMFVVVVVWWFNEMGQICVLNAMEMEDC